MRCRLDRKWTHEYASTMLFRHMVDESTNQNENRPIDLSTEEVKLICDYIEGNSHEYTESKYYNQSKRVGSR